MDIRFRCVPISDTKLSWLGYDHTSLMCCFAILNSSSYMFDELHPLVLFQRVNVDDDLPYLFIRQYALPADHRSAWPSRGNAPEEIIVRSDLAQFNQILRSGIERGSCGTVAVTLRAVAGRAVRLEHGRARRRGVGPKGIGLACIFSRHRFKRSSRAGIGGRGGCSASRQRQDKRRYRIFFIVLRFVKPDRIYSTRHGRSRTFLSWDGRAPAHRARSRFHTGCLWRERE